MKSKKRLWIIVSIICVLLGILGYFTVDAYRYYTSDLWQWKVRDFDSRKYQLL